MGRKIMQFIIDNDLYKIARITGPNHNFLAIRLSEKKCNTKATPLPIKQGDTERLDKKTVLAQVLDGLDKVNQDLGKQYFLSEIQFIPSDTESQSIYEFLVGELIKRIDSNGEFKVV
jgi:hypothetical protein